MMRTSTVAIVLAVLCAGTSWAQSGSRNYGNTRARNNSLSRGPTVSPYLNLITTTNDVDSLSGRYQTLVRPQFDLQRSLSQTQRSLRNLQTNVNTLQLNTSLPAQATPLGFQQQGYTVTGHPSYFMTHLHYYPINSR